MKERRYKRPRPKRRTKTNDPIWEEMVKEIEQNFYRK